MKRRPSNFASSSTAPFIPTYFRLLNGEGESIGPRVNNVEVGRFSTSVEGFFFLPFDFIPDPSFFRLKNFPRSFQGKIWRRISNDECTYVYICSQNRYTFLSSRIFMNFARSTELQNDPAQWRISRDAHFEVSRKEFWFCFSREKSCFSYVPTISMIIELEGRQWSSLEDSSRGLRAEHVERTIFPFYF